MVLKTGTRISFCFTNFLILFLIFAGCLHKLSDIPSSITIQWRDSVAKGLIIPVRMISGADKNSIGNLLEVHLIHETPGPPIFGEFTFTDDVAIFEPLVPLTRGLSYEIRFRDESIGRINIPISNSYSRAEVLNIYPTTDSVPLNLLKVYIEFSKPVREDKVLEHVVLLNGIDTVPEVFLDLQPALWNKEGTMLTLWLDPGRIKRDLQPNQKMGAPLATGGKYQLMIREDWQSTDGNTLHKSFEKKFVVELRDSISPNPHHWTITTPRSATLDALIVELHESLDYILLKEAIEIYNSFGKRIEVNIMPANRESTLVINPMNEWKAGRYEIRIESRLEDLSGNNLNRLFDRDITIEGPGVDKDFFQLNFHVH